MLQNRDILAIYRFTLVRGAIFFIGGVSVQSDYNVCVQAKVQEYIFQVYLCVGAEGLRLRLLFLIVDIWIKLYNNDGWF